MWVGIACMSVCVPFSSDIAPKAKKRAPFNIVGSLIFVALYYALPKWVHPYIGIIGGIGVGYSAGYSWQTVYNTFGALYIALWNFRRKDSSIVKNWCKYFCFIIYSFV
ncbi:MAG: FUSC family protein [Eubacterium ventriosum]